LNFTQKTHLGLGVTCLAWFVFQVVMGIIVRLLQYYSFIQPRLLLFCIWIHRCSGFSIIIIAKINVLVGWFMTNKAAFAILFVDAFMMISLFILKNLK
jgi:hypothetical protein